MGLIDSHIHLDDVRYQADRTGLLETAKEQGVTDWVVPSVNSDRMQSVIELQGPHVHIALGLHPYWTAEHHESDLDVLADAIENHDVVAVGECGLDYFLPDLNRDKQMTFFDGQIELAKAHDLPLILHVRSAVQAVFERLKAHNYFRAVMHSFSGSVEQAKSIMQKGVYLGFGAAGLNPKARKIQAVIQSIPSSHLMLETDGPDQPFYDQRGQRMLPQHLTRVCDGIAQLKGLKSSDLAASNSHNCKQLFGL